MTAKELLRKLSQERFDVKGLDVSVRNDVTGQEFRIDAVELREDEDDGAKEVFLIVEKQNVR